MTRTPAEVFPPGEYLEDEMIERKWTRGYVAQRLLMTEDFLDRLIKGEEKLNIALAEHLHMVFGSDAVTWLHLEKTWRKYRKENPCPPT